MRVPDLHSHKVSAMAKNLLAKATHLSLKSLRQGCLVPDKREYVICALCTALHEQSTKVRIAQYVGHHPCHPVFDQT
jgi:hypothetical protein